MSEVAADAVEGEVASAMPTEAPEVAEEPAATAAEETKPEKPAEEKRGKPPKERKPREKIPAHPPYFQMIKEAIVALQDKSGSSTYAIAKHIEEKHKAVLPANFKKMLTLQLKNFTAKGKLIKIKASFKLSELGKKEEPVKSISAARNKPKPTTSSTKTRAGKRAAAKAAKNKRGRKKGGKSATPKTKQPISIKSPAAKRAKKVSAV